MTEKEVLLGKSLEELQAVALSVGLPKFAGKQLAQWLYVRRVTEFDMMTNLSLKGREALKARYTIGRRSPVREVVSIDGTRKYLFGITSSSPSGEGVVEAVYIPEEERATLCVSTQAGCKMGCRFCMTGTLGFHGHLTAADILNQIFHFMPLPDSSQRLPFGGAPITNIVFMGEGEPMDNIDTVLRVLHILTADYGCAFSPKRITVSTVGIPAMKRFLDESGCHLAVSLHNPFPAERALIMPAERIMSLTDIISLIRQYDWSHQRRISFEYICFDNQTVNGQVVNNLTIRHANELLRLLRGINCRVNLIRFHQKEISSSYSGKKKSEETLEWFRNTLSAGGVTTTIRRSRGEDILAACGMLVNASLNEH